MAYITFNSEPNQLSVSPLSCSAFLPPSQSLSPSKKEKKAEQTQMKKNKMVHNKLLPVWNRLEMGFERRGEGSSGTQSQEDQELTAAAAAASLITEYRSEHQILDVTNKVK